MVVIKPFKGFRYNPELVGDLAQVVTPPYDVISAAQQQMFENRSDYNYVHLILPFGDDDTKYESSANLLAQWIEESVFMQDPDESIYIYAHHFNYGGKEYDRLGFVALLELEELGNNILPHEKTFPKPMEDRLKLMAANHSNLEQIFLIYDDKRKTIESMLVDAIEGISETERFTDDDGGIQQLYRISDESKIAKLVDAMQDQQCVIADGHHRYKTSLEFMNQHPEIPAARYRLVTFVNSMNDGLLVLPTNRLLYNLGKVDVKKVFQRLGKYFTVQEMPAMQDIIEQMASMSSPRAIGDEKHVVFGMQCNFNDKKYLLSLKDFGSIEEFFPDCSDAYKHLDLAILHKVVIEQCLGIRDEDLEIDKNVDYVKGVEETIRRLKDKTKYQMGFFVNAASIDEIFQVTRAGEIMPPKTTFFYPKMYSGLVFWKMER